MEPGAVCIDRKIGIILGIAIRQIQYCRNVTPWSKIISRGHMLPILLILCLDHGTLHTHDRLRRIKN
jgi:hypothetical protein